MDAGTRSMIDHLPTSTGRSLDDWFVVLDATGLEKHGELMAHLKQQHVLTHGFANGIVLQYRGRGVSTADDDLVDAQYAGAKAALRPIHDAIVAAARGFGDDVEVAPKRTSVSLRRSKQFAVVEAASAKRVQVGINLKGDPPTDRLRATTGMCTHRVDVTTAADVDDELVGWLRAAYDRA